MLHVETHAASHIGRVRKGNEDNYLVLSTADAEVRTGSQSAGEAMVESRTYDISPTESVVVAVSDGMGGALAGEVASTMAVETVAERLMDADTDDTVGGPSTDYDLVAKLYTATVHANYLIHQRGRTESEYQGMGATFTAVALSGTKADVVQVGDSRAYLLRAGRIYLVTKDQSLVQQLIDANQISEAEAETHSLKNVILQALGAQNEIFPVSARLEARSGDIFIVCSDGLSNKVTAASMQSIVGKHSQDLAAACSALVKQANDNGGEDNITVVLARVSGEELKEAAANDDIRVEVIDMANIHDTAEQDRETSL